MEPGSDSIVSESLQNVMDFAFLTNLAMALLILFAGYLLGRSAKKTSLRLLNGRGVAPAIANYASVLLRWLVIGLALVAALEKIGVQTTSIIALLGAAGLAIGLALQDTLSNVASGIMLLVLHPFAIGDRITVADEHGDALQIGIFTTTLARPSGEIVTVPNRNVLDSSIINFSKEGRRRGRLAVGVAYGSDLREARRVVLEAVRGLDMVLDDPGPMVEVAALGASSVDLEVLAWCLPGDWERLSHSVLEASYDALNEAGIDIPFQQLVVHQA